MRSSKLRIRKNVEYSLNTVCLNKKTNKNSCRYNVISCIMLELS